MFESGMTPKMAETAPDCHQRARQNNASPRREMLRGLGVMAMAGLLAACQVVPKTGGPVTPPPPPDPTDNVRSEEHTSELQSLMRNSYAVVWSKEKKKNKLV